MKILMALIAALSLAGCSSFESNARDMHKVNTTYCEGVGFKSYTVLSRSVVFVCKDGRTFMVRM
jgi:hypothetical protein